MDVSHINSIKMKVFYSRVSTQEQNDERQLQDINGFDYIFKDKCSGSIDFLRDQRFSK